MSPEVMNVIMLIAITLVAFSVAINSKGPIKMTLSYVIASALLILSVMTLTLNLDKINGQIQPEPIVDEIAPAPEPEPQPQPVVTKKPEVNQKAISKFMKDGKYWINKGIIWSKAINSFNLDNLYDLNDDEYEELISEAKKYQYKAATVYRKINSLKAPSSSTQALKRKLQSAGKSLNDSSIKLVRFFSAENEKEENQLEEEFISYSKRSLTEFNRLKSSF